MRSLWRKRWQLYGLSADEGETRDIAAQNPAIAARMRAIIDASHLPSPTYNAQVAKDLQSAARERKARQSAKSAAPPAPASGAKP